MVDEKATAIPGGMERLFNNQCQNKWILQAKSILNPFLTPYTKII
jgi:hypothetical protein